MMLSAPIRSRMMVSAYTVRRTSLPGSYWTKNDRVRLSKRQLHGRSCSFIWLRVDSVRCGWAHYTLGRFPFLPHLLRPNLLRPEIHLYFSTAGRSCIGEVFSTILFQNMILFWVSDICFIRLTIVIKNYFIHFWKINKFRKRHTKGVWFCWR